MFDSQGSSPKTLDSQEPDSKASRNLTEPIPEDTVEIELLSDDPPADEDPVRYEALLKLRDKLHSLNYNPELSTHPNGRRANSLTFHLPQGRKSREIKILEEAAQDLLMSDLESWRSLQKYNGIWNVADGSIEVALQGIGFASSPGFQLRRIAHRFNHEQNDARIELIDQISGMIVTIGDSSVEKTPLLRGSKGIVRGTRPVTSMRINASSVRTTDDADAFVELIADSVLFDLSVSFGVNLVPQRLETMGRVHRLPARVPRELQFPRNKYPHAAVTLYQSGHDRATSPLIRYWAFYQVLEYFFPKFTQDEAVRQLSRHLRHPRFDAHNEEDILRTVDLALAAGKNYEPEEKQLHTTIKSIVNPQEMVSVIAELGITEQLADKRSELSQKIVRTSRDQDLLLALSERIYDIRCKIVHSKDSDVRVSGPGLLPGTHHDDLVLNELPLLEYLAQQALLASAERLVIHGE